ncbi:hypothetical protein [Paracoccus sp. ME4]|uniref:hypothetical protein n=1 Tax=Paracoccus sp. ME4 TaxID=3138066 RepID=UPI00398B60C2
MMHNHVHPVSRSGLARLLLTTAMLGAAPAAMMPGAAMGQSYFLDNLDRDPASGLNPGSGRWSEGDAIWAREDGTGHADLPRGATAVLRQDDPVAPPTRLEIQGTVRPGSIEVDSNGFTLAGGTIGRAGDGLVFRVVDGVRLAVSSTLAGAVAVEGAGTLNYSGQARMDSLTVRGDAQLETDATAVTETDLTLEDRAMASLNGLHIGDVSVARDAQLGGSGTIDGTVRLDGRSVLSGAVGTLEVNRTGRLGLSGDMRVDEVAAQEGALVVGAGRTLTVAQGGLVNDGSLTLGGTLDLADGAALENAGDLVMAGGALTGALRNLVGATLRFASTAADTVTTQVGGDLRNDGTIAISGTGDQVLDLGGNDFVSDGTITRSGTGTLRIIARMFQLEDGSRTDLGLVELVGEIGNAGLLRVTGAGRLGGDLANGPSGQVEVDGVLDAAGFAIANAGQMTIADTGAVEGAGALSNDGTLRVEGRLVADSIGNDGDLIADGAEIAAEIENRGRMTVTGDVAVAGDMRNLGTLRSDGEATLRLADGRTFRNEGDVDGRAGPLTIVAETIELVRDIDTAVVDLVGRVVTFADLVFSRDGRLTGDLNIGATGNASVRADIDADGFDVRNDGLLTIGRDRLVLPDDIGRLTGIGTFENRGTTDILARSTLAADQSVNRAGGRLTVGGTLTGDVTNDLGATLRLDGGTLRGDVASAGTLGGTGTITGRLTNTGEAAFAGAVDVLDNRGTFATGGDLDAGEVLNGARLTVADGDVLSTERGLSNGGDLVLQGGTVDGGIANTGTITGRGTLGDVTGSGALLVTTGDIAAGSVAGTGRIEIGATRRLSVERGVQAAGAVQVAGVLDGALNAAATGTVRVAGTGRVTGALTNAGDLELLAGARVDGQLTNRGTARLAGAVQDIVNAGDLTVAGALGARNVTNEAAGRLTVAAGGTLTASGEIRNGGLMQLLGSTSARALANAGTLVLGGRLTADIINTGDLTVGAGAAVAGDLDNRGRLILSPDVAALDLTGSTFTNSGSIEAGPGRTARVIADLHLLRAGSVIDTALVELVGRIDNAGRYLITTATRLGSGFDNRAGGQTAITARLDAAGQTVTNAGEMTIAAGDGTGALVGADRFVSSGRTVVENGTVLQARSVEVTGGTLQLAGRMAGAVTTRAGSRTDLAGGTIAGSVLNEGTLVGTGSIDGAVVNRGELRATGALTLSDVGNSGLMSVAGTGSVTLDGLDNTGTVAIAAGGRLAASGDLANDGRIALAGQMDLAGGTGTLDNRSGGVLDLQGGRLLGALENQDGGRVVVAGDNSLSGNLTNAGIIEMTTAGEASLTVEGGTFVNRGTVTSRNRGELRIIADRILLENAISNRFVTLVGQVFNIARLDFERDTVLRADLSNALGGVVGVFASVDGAGFDVLNEGGLEIGDDRRDGALTGVEVLSNSGTVNVTGRGRLEAADIRNLGTGEITVAGVLGGPVTNAATARLVLDGGRVEGPVQNAGSLTGQGAIAGGLTNAGSATIGGSVDRVVNTGSLTSQGTLTIGNLQSSGRLDVAGGSVLRVTDPIANTGRTTVSGRIEGGVATAASGRFDLTGGTVTGALTNAGTASLQGRIGGTVRNGGSLSTTGDLQVGALINDGNATVGAGHALTAADGVTNAGDLRIAGTVEGRVQNAAGAELRLSQGSRVSGPVSNAGTLSGTGRIDGALGNAGTAVLGGSVGAVTNTGRLEVAGNLSAAAVSNAGEAVVGTGDALSVSGTLRNSGDLSVGGRVTAAGGITNVDDGRIVLDGAQVAADVTNAAGARLDIVSDSSVTGDLVNRGTIDLIGQTEQVRLSVQDGSFTNSGVVQVSGAGFLTIEADEILLQAGSVVDNARVQLLGAVSNGGQLTFCRDTALEGDLRNGPDGSVTIAARIDGAGRDIINGGTLTVGGADRPGRVTGLDQLVNSGTVSVGAGSVIGARQISNAEGGDLTVAGSVNGAVENAAGGTIRLADGTVSGSLRNEGALSGTGRVTGTLTNRGTAAIGGGVGRIDNAGQLTTQGDLTAGRLDNGGTTTVRGDDRLTVAETVVNGGQLRVLGVLDGSVLGGGALLGNGTITGAVESRGRMDWSGRIDGRLLNAGTASLSGQVGGALRNEGQLQLSGDLSVGGALRNVGGDAAGPAAAAPGGATLQVRRGQTLSVAGGIVNEAGADLTNDGRIAATIDNRGTYRQTGTLAGSLASRGEAVVLGAVTGDLDFVSGRLTLGEAARIGGTLTLRQDYAVEAGTVLDAARTVVAQDTRLDLDGRLAGALASGGIVAVSGRGASVEGTLTNAGRVDLSGDRRTDGLLTVGGLEGAGGALRLDVDLAEMTADRVTVRGGAVTGDIRLDLNRTGSGSVSQPGRRVTLLDVDDGFAAGNSFGYSANTDFAASERIVFSVEQMGQGGDLTLVSQTNPAIGALFGNVALTQSLIGSVVNRPSSPFVTGLAFDEPEKPCGAGAWGRAIGGHATAQGATDNGVSRVDSQISATYGGMQVGSDLACFDGRAMGWDTAFGVLGGVNQGKTSQPVYAIDGRNSQSLSRTLSSITSAEFTQVYGGLYATATKDRWQADLQVRHERTDFTVSNRAVGGSGAGLGLDDADFTGTANTVSGSLSYMLALGEGGGWAVVPTAGFAWSKLSTDPIRFADEFVLRFEDSERKIGFVGGTVARTYVQPADNTALNVFATGTVYKDFADPTVSIFSGSGAEAFDEQRLVSDNLGTYGEVSLGANYIKVLPEGSWARQFSTSTRIDVRYGESLDSVGVTGQVRWQF